MAQELDTEEIAMDAIEKIRDKYPDKEECIDNLNYAISILRSEVRVLEDIPDDAVEEE